MLYSIKDENDAEVIDDKLRNEVVFAAQKDMSYTYFNDEKYNIEKIKIDRKGFKELKIRKD